MEKPQDPKDISENPFQQFAAVNLTDSYSSGSLPPEDPIQEPSVTEDAKVQFVGAPPTAEEQSPKQYPQFICTDEYGREVKHYDPQDSFQRYMQKRMQEVSFPHEQPHTAEERACIEEAQKGVIAAAAEVGVDVRDRVFTPDRYHFFDTDEAYREDTRAVLDEKIIGQNGGMFNAEAGILWVRGSMHDLQYGMTHETAHGLAASKVYFQEERDATRQTTGELANVSKYDGYLSASGLIDPPNGFNEMVTEMLTHRASERNLYSYGMHVILGGAAVREVAAFHKMQPREIEDELLRGYLTGDEKGLILFDEALGLDRMNSLLTLPGKLSSDEGLALAEQLQLPGATEAIMAFKQGKSPHPFDW